MKSSETVHSRLQIFTVNNLDSLNSWRNCDDLYTSVESMLVITRLFKGTAVIFPVMHSKCYCLMRELTCFFSRAKWLPTWQRNWFIVVGLSEKLP